MSLYIVKYVCMKCNKQLVCLIVICKGLHHACLHHIECLIEFLDCSIEVEIPQDSSGMEL